MGLGYRFMEFMRGRYGWDRFGFFLMVVSFVIELLGRILRLRWVYYIGLALFCYMVFRMLSRNIPARVRENQMFMDLRNRFANWRYFRQQSRGQRQQARDDRQASQRGGTIYCYYYCPQCKQQVRIPAGQGKVRIHCPRCNHHFDAYS